MSLSASIIIPSYNQPDLTRSCLDSLRDQAAENFEVIVVDDGSTISLKKNISIADYPFGLQILRLDPNRGRAAARNRGIRTAAHDILIFLDGDMTVNPEFVRSHLAAHNDQPEQTVVVGNIITAPDVYHDIADKSIQIMARYIDTRGVHKIKPGEPIPYRYFVTGNSSVRKTFLERVGLFDENFPVYGGEDLELACRMNKHSVQLVYSPKARSYHHDIKPLATHIQRMEDYGRLSVPLIIKRHPEAGEFLGLAWVDRVYDSKLIDRVKRFPGRILSARLTTAFLTHLIKIPIQYWQFFCLDIITGGSYLRGYSMGKIR